MKSSTPNRLINETSPYLLQHAYNPVDWYAWGEEALQKAKEEGKPILVSIGYAACHWCHVMERESFEDAQVAAYMNENFVNIKIDREERPDLDHIYMDAVQAMTGSGGWPLNVFLTTEAKPFYGGTYFPPQKAYNRPSWMDVLQGVANGFANKKNEIEAQAENLTEHLVQSNNFGVQKNTDAAITEDDLHTIFQNILKSADRQEGGFGKAPKFPQFAVIQFLLKYASQFNDKEALQQATLSLDKMIYGGIYDQLGGGIARYSTDNEWLVPHFEKMLYDNALLVITLSEAYQLTHQKQYLSALHQTMEFIKRDMLHADGSFFSAIDADSEGVEGKYYVWSKKEVEEITGGDAAIFCSYFDITEDGNWEGVNILRIKKSLKIFASEMGMDENNLLELIQANIKLLLTERYKRVPPLLDDKIILNWNALMNTACCKAFAATGNDEYRQLAIDNMQFILKTFEAKETGSFCHTYKKGMLKFPAFLDDYAYLIQSLIHLQEITGDGDYLMKARNITDHVLQDFTEESSGYFYFTGIGQKDVIVRKKEVYDGALPSGNAMMAFNLHYLGTVFDNNNWILHSKKMILNLSTAIVKYPVSFGAWASGLYSILYAIPLIILSGEKVDDLRKEILFIFIPYKILQSSTHENENFPLLVGKNTNFGPKIYLCKNNTCLDPVTTVDLLIEQLKK